jgi:HAD superfamily hydrolase (TIGR01509 family)
MKKAALIFDHDGTLVDSIEAVAYCTNAVIAAAGYEAVPEDEVRKGMAFPTLERFRYHSGSEDEDLLNEMYHGFYASLNEKGVELVKLYPGIRETLDLLAFRGYSLGMVTNNQGFFVRRAAARLEYAYDFEVILGEENVPSPKPDPRGLLQACAGLGAKPEDCWYLGDGKPDYDVARAAGLNVGLVTWGAHSRDVLEALNPDRMFDSPYEIGEFFL